MGNKVRYGFEKVKYAPISESDGAVTYGTVKDLPGAISISLEVEGDTSVTYADNVAYFTTSSNNGYSGTLSFANLPDTFKKDVLGFIEDDSGRLVEDAGVAVKDFGLACQFEGDVNQVRYQFFRVTPERPKIDGKTKEDKIVPDTVSLNVRITPVVVGDHKWIKAETDSSNSAAYTKMLTEITLPTITN